MGSGSLESSPDAWSPRHSHMPDTTTIPDALAVVIGPVDQRLRAVLEDERRRWSDIDPALDEPFDALAELVLVGGKRLRPAFFHWAHVGAGGPPFAPDALDAAAAIEMLHAFALAHDDIMDASLSRRGHPTVPVSYTHLTLPTMIIRCRSRWSPYH